MITLENINDFYEAQFREWPGLKASYDALMTAKRRIMDMAGMNVGLQYNPQRRQSTEAAVDSSSLAKRPCFLCKANRPKEQQSLKIIDGWDWLINPYPIFPVHFTIVSKAHEPQEEIPLDMVAAADAAPCLAFFYNGARSGASAPDHLHFQATLKDELPLLPIVERCHTADKSGIMLSTDFPADLPMKFWSLVVMPDPTGMQLLSILPKLYGFDATTGAPDPGMVNVIVWMDASRRLRVVVFPRKRHRPARYYAEEKDRCLVSPGAVDMAGLFILPRKEDFDRLDTEGIKDIYDQCGLTADELQELQTRPAMTLTIGIHTDGIPVISRHRGSLTVENALMGVGFHWQRRYPLRLKTERYALADGNDGIWLICETGLEDYLRSVVSSEMNPEAPEEFIKAHAIIARSWALRQVGARKPEGKEEKHRPCRPTILTRESKEIIRIFDGSDHSGFDLCNDDHCQRFQGEDAVTPRAEKAVKETEGLVLLDKHGKIADARYSKCCGGRTELFSTCWQDRDHDYLQSVNDPWCDLSRLPEEERQRILKSVMKDYDRTTTPNFLRWQRHVDASGIANKLSRDFHINIGTITNLRPVASGPSGRISRLEIQGTDGTTVIGKELSIRRLLADDCLLSSAFTAEKADRGFLLHGRGWGHGVGLCQIGAAAMAAAGHSAEEILSHYYPGTRLSHFESAS